MTNYKSDSEYLILEIFLMVILGLFLVFMLYNSIESIIILFITIFSGISFFTYMILRARRRLLKINFNEDQILIEFQVLKKVEKIDYSEIKELKYFTGYRSSSKNIMKYKFDNKIRIVRFKPVAQNQEYIKFVKWLKAKNENIKITMHPSDSKLNHFYQKEFGFKYTKVLNEA